MVRIATSEGAPPTSPFLESPRAPDSNRLGLGGVLRAGPRATFRRGPDSPTKVYFNSDGQQDRVAFTPLLPAQVVAGRETMIETLSPFEAGRLASDPELRRGAVLCSVAPEHASLSRYSVRHPGGERRCRLQGLDAASRRERRRVPRRAIFVGGASHRQRPSVPRTAGASLAPDSLGCGARSDTPSRSSGEPRAPARGLVAGVRRDRISARPRRRDRVVSQHLRFSTECGYRG